MVEETLVETMEEISVVTFSFGRIVEEREERRNRGLVGGYENYGMNDINLMFTICFSLRLGR